MGNILSLIETEKESGKTFGQVLDFIATYYILTLDFQSLKKLNEKDYCDNLIVLTSDILDRYFNNSEITYLAQRIKNGVEINEMAKDNIKYFNKETLDKTNIINSIKKKRVCIGIAKFYIKIAHIFAAIVTTINPVYIYKDADGTTIKKKLFEKDQIPPNVQRKLYKMGICDTRINALKHGQSLDTEEVQNIHPKVCDMNIGSDGETKSLGDEPGVPELMDLYLDKYDYSSGNFIGMTDETKKEYYSDLARFYRVFTGNELMPPTIQKFSDIKLKDFQKLEACAGTGAPLRTHVKLDKKGAQDKVKEKLFEEYAENLKQMVRSVNKNQEDLLEVINDLFTYVVDPQTKKKRIIVHPKLSETLLQEVVVKTRKIIINLYLKCETDYALGVKIYQAIVENQIKDTTLNQISTLEKETEKLINLEPGIAIGAKIQHEIKEGEPPDFNEDGVPQIQQEKSYMEPEEIKTPFIEPQNNAFKPEMEGEPQNNAFKPEMEGEPQNNAFKPEMEGEPQNNAFKPEIGQSEQPKLKEPDIIPPKQF